MHKNCVKSFLSNFDEFKGKYAIADVCFEKLTPLPKQKGSFELWCFVA